MSGAFGKSESSSSQQSRPLSADEVAAYFYKLDELTGGTPGTRATPAVMRRRRSSRVQDDTDSPNQMRRYDDPYGYARAVVERPAQPGTPRTPGRLLNFATEGTPATPYEGLTPEQIEEVSYQSLTPEQLRDFGGAGATRELQATRARQQAVEELTADPSLSTFQRQRTRQLTDQDYGDRLDAIAKETEALMTGAAQTDAQRQFEAGKARTDVRSNEAARRYEAALKNANLTREDLITLANIFFGGRGQASSGSGSSSAFNIAGGIGK